MKFQTIYNPKEIEQKWQKEWLKRRVYQPDLEKAKKPYYNLMMFPYPSAEGLHVGNMYAFTGADVYGRFKRMQGYDVFQPIGLDGFGIHSENYAIKVGRHPIEHAKVSEKHFYEQLHLIGNGFAWDQKLETYDPDYYKWTQWLFIQMYKHGLAYRKKAMVNWCPSCKTVLSDEQVEGGVCERCKTPTTRKETEQWFFKITAYADRLLNNLEKIDWPKKIRVAQRNWIGKTKGLTIEFRIEGSSETIPIWTKFWETVFGTTFLVLAPEHDLVTKIENIQIYKFTNIQRKKIVEYVKQSLKKTEQERKAGKEKTGVFIGLYAINPVNQEKVPIWIADYVMMDVGTGAVMGVPAHDERDFEFAKNFNLMVRPVVSRANGEARSYLMGGKNISSKELEELGIEIVEQTEDGDRKILIPKASLKPYEKIVEEKLSPGYWNEYVGTDTTFVFKGLDGSLQKIKLTPDTFLDIAKKCSELNNDPIEKTSNLWLYLAENDWYRPLIVHEQGGMLINSGQFNGLDAWGEGKQKMAAWMIEKGVARWQTTYHLRDWLISRQRYWGPPIPMIFCAECAQRARSEKHEARSQVSDASSLEPRASSQHGWFPVPEDQLPVLLPYVKDFQPIGEGKAPLEKAPKEWLETTCPNCGGKATRSTEVSDTFLDSSWYFLAYPNLGTEEWVRKSQLKSAKISLHRFTDKSAQSDVSDPSAIRSSADLSRSQPTSSELTPFNRDITKRWLPVNAYIGGAEHAVLHLLYARFVWMALRDWGCLPVGKKEKGRRSSTLRDSDPNGKKEEGNKTSWEEPFPFLFSHGLIIKDGAKMSKSRGNVVTPDEYISRFGADTLRMYLMFVGPYDQGGDFRDTGIAGMYRFLERIFRAFQKQLETRNSKLETENYSTAPELQTLLHRTIKRVTEDLEKFKYNTAIARLMEFMNAWEGRGKSEEVRAKNGGLTIAKDDAISFLKLLAPFAPHIADELYHRVKPGDEQSIHELPWSAFDDKLTRSETIAIPIQVNGKTRAVIDIDANDANEETTVVRIAHAHPAVAKHLSGRIVARQIFVPSKTLNFVIQQS